MATDFEMSESPAPGPVVKQRSTLVPTSPARNLRSDSLTLLDHLRSSVIRLPGRHRAQKAFLRFLKKTGSDRRFIEQMQRLRDSIILSTLREKPAFGGVTIGLTGAVGGEGTSFLSLLLSLSLGECTHRRLAVLDGRFNLQRFAILSEFLGLSRNLVTLQKGPNEVIAYYNERYPNISFLRSSGNEQSLQFFSDKRLGLFLGEMRKNFDFTIIDLPPLLKETASVFALPLIDRLYIVAAAGKTRLSQIDRCVATVRDAGAQVAGIILNKQQTPLWSRLFWREFFY